MAFKKAMSRFSAVNLWTVDQRVVYVKSKNVLLCSIQCSSDISELRIRVLYARILRIRVCLYAYVHTCIRVCQYARICPFVMHSNKFLYMKHCWSNKGHVEMKRLQSEICILLKRHADE